MIEIMIDYGDLKMDIIMNNMVNLNVEIMIDHGEFEGGDYN